MFVQLPNKRPAQYAMRTRPTYQMRVRWEAPRSQLSSLQVRSFSDCHSGPKQPPLQRGQRYRIDALIAVWIALHTH